MCCDKKSGGRIVVVSAPSGCGKSTIINALLPEAGLRLRFSVSATNRPPRPGEVDGVNYNFLTTDRFRQLIEQDKFVEYEEVFPGRFYGTLQSEVDRITAAGDTCILDIDVKGALNIKRRLGSAVKTIFVMPPDIDTLRRRLVGRATESMEEIEKRLSRAEFEISQAEKFDCIIVNNDLDKAIADMRLAITQD